MKNMYEKVKRVLRNGAFIGLMAAPVLTSCGEYHQEENLAAYRIIDVDKDGQADLMYHYGLPTSSAIYYAEGFENDRHCGYAK